VLEPWIGDLSARQIGVLTGSFLFLIVTYLLVDWIGAKTSRQLGLIGTSWVLLTLAFEIGAGRFLLEYS
jgi:Na+/melibiose symporter-like transporter